MHTRCGLDTSPYRGREAVLATMHAKERAIAAPMLERLGLAVTLPAGIDTDALGTFTGDVPRAGDMREAAIAKARLGMRLTGHTLGMASEGAYGPHPVIPFVASGVEILVVVDAERGLEIMEQLRVDATNFGHRVVRPQDDLQDFLTRTGFPQHAVVVQPNRAGATAAEGIVKGLRDAQAVVRAVRDAASLSTDGKALVQADMRAHMNPTRMHAIGELAERAAARLASVCSDCGAPGFGLTRMTPGLCCAVCSMPTRMARAVVHGCVACDHEIARPRDDGLTHAPARHCDFCNP